MLPERKGNRMNSEIVCSKTYELGWKETESIEDYIKKIVDQ